ncbi:FecR family protein [Niabella insulamsoli]|uniref:FecR family protein n=1 Tax=Niabella insulamsoli TaxID=3144874 RepID=UPI0031FC2320
MNKERLIELLIKKQSGTITLPESLELKEYLKTDAEQEQLSDLLGDVLEGRFHQQQSYSKDEIDTRLQKIHSRLHAKADTTRQKNHSFRWLLRAVAAVVIIAFSCLALYYYTTNSDDPGSTNILATKKGSKSSLVLPDGTKVLLNADTKLSYNQSFGKKVREVALEGEAYFEVVRDSEHPFIVHTKAMDVKVLGTVFNVRAYKDEKNTQTTLIKGSVEVTLKSRNDKVLLKPNEKIIVNNHIDSSLAAYAEKDVANISVVPVKTSPTDSSIIETEWTKNRLAFDQASYSEVFAELERWYGVSVTIKDAAILKRKISGSYENEEISEVLESLKLATGFRYKLENHQLIIY